MRIDIQIITAVLSLAAILFPCLSTQSDLFSPAQKSFRRSSTRRENKVFAWSTGSDFEESEGRPWLTHREHLMLLKQEGGEEGHAVECCPSRLDMIEPEGGKNQDDMYVELYKDGETRQRFYEISCREDVFNKPCRFLDKRLSNQSKCVQKYSYTYALVRDTSAVDQGAPSRHHHQYHHHERGGFVSKEWKMDYIRVRSGCSCEILPKLKKKRNNSKNKKNHRSRRFHLEFEADET